MEMIWNVALDLIKSSVEQTWWKVLVRRYDHRLTRSGTQGVGGDKVDQANDPRGCPGGGGLERRDG